MKERVSWKDRSQTLDIDMLEIEIMDLSNDKIQGINTEVCA